MYVFRIVEHKINMESWADMESAPTTCVCDLFYDAGKIDFLPDALNKFVNIFYTGI